VVKTWGKKIEDRSAWAIILKRHCLIYKDRTPMKKKKKKKKKKVTF